MTKLSKPNINATLVPEKFKEWLLKQPSRGGIGISNNPKSCPIARYLMDTFKLEGEFSVQVQTTFVMVSTQNYLGIVDMPNWGFLFIHQADSLINKNSTHKAITRKTALDILEKVTA